MLPPSVTVGRSLAHRMRQGQLILPRTRWTLSPRSASHVNQPSPQSHSRSYHVITQPGTGPYYSPQPPSGGSGRKAFIVVLSGALLAGVAYIGYHDEQANKESSDEHATLPDARPRWFQENAKKWLEIAEDLTDEPVSGLYRTVRAAIAREDWPEARRALSEAWKATEGHEPAQRLVLFHPGLIRPLYKLHVDSNPDDQSAAVSFVEEVVPVMDEARAQPMPDIYKKTASNRGMWEWLFMSSLGLRTMAARSILSQQVKSSGPVGLSDDDQKAQRIARVGAMIQPMREEVIRIMEGIKSRGNYSYSTRDVSIIDDFCFMTTRYAHKRDNYLDAIRFARYRVMINQRKSPIGTSQALIEVADFIDDYFLEVKNQPSNKSHDAPFFKSRTIRPEFHDADLVLMMPLEDLAKGNAQELTRAAQHFVNAGLKVLSDQGGSDKRRQVYEVQGFTLAARFAKRSGDVVESRKFFKLAEEAARLHEERTGDGKLVKKVQLSKRAAESDRSIPTPIMPVTRDSSVRFK